jgi:hypothetical protein
MTQQRFFSAACEACSTQGREAQEGSAELDSVEQDSVEQASACLVLTLAQLEQGILAFDRSRGGRRLQKSKENRLKPIPLKRGFSGIGFSGTGFSLFGFDFGSIRTRSLFWRASIDRGAPDGFRSQKKTG